VKRTKPGTWDLRCEFLMLSRRSLCNGPLKNGVMR